MVLGGVSEHLNNDQNNKIKIDIIERNKKLFTKLDNNDRDIWEHTLNMILIVIRIHIHTSQRIFLILVSRNHYLPRIVQIKKINKH